jgi:8-oxo-dGTP pyrophosphatase MutT (NUDIX family)
MPRALHLVLLRVYRRLPASWRLRAIHLLAPTFTVGAICVIDRGDDHILLVRHSYRDRWGFPGGLLKRNEQPDVGARREAMEEVGLEVELLGQPLVVVEPSSRRVDLVYRGRPAAGTDLDAVRPRSVEILRAEWHPRNELPELQHEAAGALVALARTLP